ncbi:MAG: hypothetical protein O7B25_08045 [Gammaproteobacteria bacterium]|nr:hypothetical protein [Gammaproteobacteria bacterium]
MRQSLKTPNLRVAARAPRRLLALTLIIALVAPITVSAAKNLFRFVNDEGVIETSDTLPTDRAAHGYEVIDRSGRVLEVVEAQKSPEEIARIARETKKLNACQDALSRVNSLYQSELDISEAEKHTLNSLAVRIVYATDSLRRAKNTRRELEAAAAQREREGRSLQKSLVNNIESAISRVENLEREIEQRRHEQDDAGLRFANELALFKQATCANQTEIGFAQGDLAAASGREG